ncbi:hypothetical protein G4B88_010302 [Cannabis sativa]|uniref:RNase H type-1 domain-containing protein n=1 Tax=Cannabis sativa TaxID=3483 RepID=A0A7J6I857_CANSA|nr:hypothetical protein G4B88_010302 [Cannabis sativa]
MAQTPVPSSRRPFSSRYSLLWFLYLIAYFYVSSLRLSISLILSSSTPIFFLSSPTMASSSSNPNPITALDDEDSLVHDFDHISIHSPTDANSTDAQDLQQAVDQFLHVDSPQSSPNAHVSVQFPQPVISTSPLPVSQSNFSPVMPSISISIPAPIMADSVSTHTTKGKGKALAMSTPTHPSLSKARKGIVINEPCPPPLTATSPVIRPTFTRLKAQEYIAAQCNYQGDQLASEAVPISRTAQQQHPPLLQPDTLSLFVDAALDQNHGLTGTGFIFKLGFQTVLASHCRHLPGAVSPIFVEGQALLESLRWCLDSQLSPKVVFSDCLNLVSKVNSAWQDNSALSGHVSRIRLLFSNFPYASLQYIPRQFNMEAHGLAKEALRQREVS